MPKPQPFIGGITPKSLFASKTVWVNAIVFIIAALAALSGSDSFVAEYPQLVTVLVLAQSALNIALRYLTTQPVELKGPGK